MAAVYDGYLSVVEILANAGANLDLRNRVSDYCIKIHLFLCERCYVPVNVICDPCYLD